MQDKCIQVGLSKREIIPVAKVCMKGRQQRVNQGCVFDICIYTNAIII